MTYGMSLEDGEPKALDQMKMQYTTIDTQPPPATAISVFLRTGGSSVLVNSETLLRYYYHIALYMYVYRVFLLSSSIPYSLKHA